LQGEEVGKNQGEEKRKARDVKLVPYSVAVDVSEKIPVPKYMGC
jgi:hypothetical protein